MGIIALIATLAAVIIGTVMFGNWMDMQEIIIAFAIAVVGAIVLQLLRRKNK